MVVVADDAVVHEYRPRLLGYDLAPILVAWLVVVLPVAVVTGHWAVIGAFIGAFAGGAVGSRVSPQRRLKLSPGGVAVGGYRVPWSNIAGISRRRVGLTFQDAFVLRKPLSFSKWVNFEKIKVLPLGQYDKDWRNGPIGVDIARWAPHLLNP